MSEKFYDEEIAPELLRISRLCEERGIPFLAAVEYAPDSIGRTECMCGKSISMQMASWAVQSLGNIDKLAGAAAAHARKHGHSATILSMMGVPHKPVKP